MFFRSSIAAAMAAACVAAATARIANGDPPTVSSAASGRYEDLTSLFAEWRAFQKPKVVDGVPDYSATAMAAQRRELPAYQRRLAAIDPSGWPVDRQVDWHVVRAEMSFVLCNEHRCKRIKEALSVNVIGR